MKVSEPSSDFSFTSHVQKDWNYFLILMPERRFLLVLKIFEGAGTRGGGRPDSEPPPPISPYFGKNNMDSQIMYLEWKFERLS